MDGKIFLKNPKNVKIKNHQDTTNKHIPALKNVCVTDNVFFLQNLQMISSLNCMLKYIYDKIKNDSFVSSTYIVYILSLAHSCVKLKVHVHVFQLTGWSSHHNQKTAV